MADRIIAEIDAASGYAGLIGAIRARINELGITFSTVDQIAGWCDSYSTKLLAPPAKSSHRPAARTLGPMSFGTLLGAVGLKLLVTVDEEATARLKRNGDFMPRKYRRHAKPLGIVGKTLAEYGSKGGRAFFASRSPAEISRHQSRAAKARWRRARAIRAQASAP
jgi:hypothetical protein